MTGTGARVTATLPCYVVFTDIVGLPEARRSVQVEWVSRLLALIGDAVPAGVDGLTIFPTGTGVIVCISTDRPDTPEAVAIPIDLSRDLLRANRDGDFKLRLSINYGSSEALLQLPAELGVTNASHLQVGDGIAFAERLIHFAEPNEIVFSGEYWDQLRKAELTTDYREFPHHDVFVKDLRYLRLFSYKPTPEEDYIYRPREEKEQHFRKFAYFPPLRAETLDRFRDLALREDLQELCTYAYDTIDAINRHRTFVTWSNVYDVLKRMPCEDGDEILVISRSDLDFDFWTTPDSLSYLRRMARAQRTCPRITHRIFLYDPDVDKPLAPNDVLNTLARLPGSMRKLDIGYARKNLLSRYRFGVTIFRRLRCAIAPIPWARSYDEYIGLIEYGRAHDAAARFEPGTDFRNSEFKALVVADDARVEELESAFRKLTGPKVPIEEVEVPG